MSRCLQERERLPSIALLHDVRPWMPVVLVNFHPSVGVPIASIGNFGFARVALRSHLKLRREKTLLNCSDVRLVPRSH